MSSLLIGEPNEYGAWLQITHNHDGLYTNGKRKTLSLHCINGGPALQMMMAQH